MSKLLLCSHASINTEQRGLFHPALNRRVHWQRAQPDWSCYSHSARAGVMKAISILAALAIAVIVQSLTIVPAGARARDHINYGYCPGSMRLMNDVSRCRKPAPDSGHCPPGQI